nr:MAG TPA: hypothetical protein [Bacteriophage sp.]
MMKMTTVQSLNLRKEELKQQGDSIVNLSESTKHEFLNVEAYQWVLAFIETKFGHKALEELVNTLKEKKPHCYNVFFQNQLLAKQLNDVPYWLVDTRENGQYGLFVQRSAYF